MPLMSDELLALLDAFYDATANNDSTCCFGCGCVDVERLRANASSWADPHPHIARLEARLAHVPVTQRTHAQDCIIQRARAALNRT